jgi:ATP-binding cassette subfamily B protein
MSATTTAPAGTADEDETRLSRAQSKAVRQRSLRLLGDLMRPHRKGLWLAGVLVVVSTVAQVAGPALIATAIDTTLVRLRDHGEWGPLLLVGGLYVVAAAVAGLSISGYVRTAARVSQGILLDLRRRVFRQTQRLSLEFHES